MENYPWYGKIDSEKPLQQGELVFSCPIVKPPVDFEKIHTDGVDIDTYNAVVISQACDLIYQKINIVQITPFVTLEAYGKKHPEFNSSTKKNIKNRNKLRDNLVIGRLLLNSCEEQTGINDYLVVDFSSTFGVDYKFLTNHVQKQKLRVCLLPPYRERLTQFYATWIMRIGSPIDIPEFK
jgi:hypothetical protein